ncbi:AfsR/SARP family transcriptional regulator [Streptomyces sp. NBC_00199]|uniref:AfsR/SARP family transcriptional regulator n=1 Tax=Streptomyces sp. NBC_00199 TaxID=2975678 RepID=UPI00224E5E11|nr:AfsR/SARP family transcriptional regulator [Streptomyces sp. NBC_00199]MCX5269218.1 AfsR/SARP family transcriptional regulator [Streptomyces sp. NBC_00199]MCX5269772.1 AfsR/SARP family transcriptional regulator [Streptomyces sp. NBC_00199]
MRFRILGPLEVRGAPGTSEALTPRAAKIRVVLATLLVRANEIVSVDSLIDELWGEDPPRTATTTLQVYISQLRKLLHEVDAELGRDALVTRPPGYELRLDPAQLDLAVLEELHGRGRELMDRQDYRGAADLQRRALGLWRGPLLSDTPHGPLLDATAVRLSETRTSALEQCIRAELHLGRHRSLIGELQEVTAELPLREEFHAHLMVALYRSGRQADALQVFARLRRGLVEELAIEPGRALQALHQRVLVGDPVLLRPAGRAERTESPPAAVTRPAAGGGAAWAAVNGELPSGEALFTGREEELVLLGEALGPPGGGLVVLSGPAGVGKSALALAAAHRAGDGFDGSALVRLRTGGGRPLDAAQVLAQLLRRFAAQGAAPAGGGEPAAVLRQSTAGRRCLLVLDDAVSADQVLPVLAAMPDSTVLVTCRGVPEGLEGRVVALGVPSARDARALLLAAAGGTAPDAAPEAGTGAADVVALCGGLPLALRAAGGLLASRPRQTCAALAARLREERTRFAELGAADPALRPRLRQAADELSDPRRRAYLLLGLLPAGPFGLRAAAALLETDQRAARETADALVRAQVLQTEPARAGGAVGYRMPELLRLLAGELLAAEVDAEVRRAALSRLCGAAADEVEAVGVFAGEPVEGRHPLDWFRGRRPVLLALVRQAHAAGLWSATLRLVDGMAGFLESLAAWEERSVCHDLALDAAQRTGDLAAQARLLRAMGDLAWQRRRVAVAEDLFERALLTADAAGADEERVRALTGLADLRLDSGATDAAAALVPGAPDASAPDRRGRFESHRLRGLLALESDDRDAARAHFVRCLTQATELADARLEAYARRRLAGLAGPPVPASGWSEVRPGVWRKEAAA